MAGGVREGPGGVREGPGTGGILDEDWVGVVEVELAVADTLREVGVGGDNRVDIGAVLACGMGGMGGGGVREGRRSRPTFAGVDGGRGMGVEAGGPIALGSFGAEGMRGICLGAGAASEGPATSGLLGLRAMGGFHVGGCSLPLRLCGCPLPVGGKSIPAAL